MNGKIIPLQLEAYDSDGLAGIYCPEASKSVKTASGENTVTINSGYELYLVKIEKR